MGAEADEIVAALLRGTADTWAVLDDDGRFHAFHCGDRYVGRGADFFVGKNVVDVVPAPIASLILGAVRATRVDGPPVEVDHQRPSPEGMRDVRARLVRRRDGTVFAHVFDVTEATRAARAAREHLERYEHLARATMDAVFDWDAKADQATWNEHLAGNFGYRGVTHTSMGWWFEHIHVDDRPEIMRSALAALDDPAVQLWTSEFRFRAADGEFREVLERSLMVRDAAGRCVRVIGAMIDLTERRKAAATAARAERVLELGTLAAGMSHEIGGPLSYVLASLSAARDTLAASDASDASNDDACSAKACVRERIGDALVGAARVVEVVNELKAFTGPRAIASARVDLADVVAVSLKMLDPALASRARLTVETERAFVDGQEHRLGQVVTNLVVNALQSFAHDRDDNEVDVTVKNGADGVALSVSDNGPGLGALDTAALFDPFVTTKEGRGGTGLGLAIAHALVTSHGGRIDVEPLARGTKFVVTLPSAHPSPEGSPPQSSSPSSSSSSGASSGASSAASSSGASSSGAVVSSKKCATERMRVLVVDDDAFTLKLADLILGRHHDVVLAQSADVALAVIGRQPVDVILSDIRMPGTDGAGLLRALRERGCTAKFGFLTGDIAVESALAPRLEKPFSPQQLLAFVSQL